MRSDGASQGGGWWQGCRQGWWRGLLHRAPPASRLRDEQHGVGSCALQPCRFGGGVDSDSTPARSHEPASRGSLYWSGYRSATYGLVTANGESSVEIIAHGGVRGAQRLPFSCQLSTSFCVVAVAVAVAVAAVDLAAQ